MKTNQVTVAAGCEAWYETLKACVAGIVFLFEDSFADDEVTTIADRSQDPVWCAHVLTAISVLARHVEPLWQHLEKLEAEHTARIENKDRLHGELKVLQQLVVDIQNRIVVLEKHLFAPGEQP